MFAKPHKLPQHHSTRSGHETENAPLGASRKLNKAASKPSLLTATTTTTTTTVPTSAPERNQDRAKLEAKVARAEERLLTQQDELNLLRREKEEREVELRLSHAREARLAASLEKSKSNGKLQHISSTLQKLTALHEASKAESSAAIREARFEAQRLREERDALVAKEREGETRLASLSGDVKSAKVALESARKESGELERKARRAQEAEMNLQALLDQLKEENQEFQRRHVELTIAVRDAESVAKSLEEAQEDLLMTQHRERALVAAACQLGAQLQRQRETTQDAALRANAAEVAVRSLRAQVVQLKRQHAEALEAVQQRAEWQVTQATYNESHSSQHFIDAEATLLSSLEADETHVVLLSDLEQRLELAQVAHSNAEARASYLAVQLDANHTARLALQLDNATLVNSVNALPLVEAELASLRATHASAMEALNEEKLARALAHAEVERANREVESVRLELRGARETNKALSARIGNARAKEERWADECDDLANALARATEYETLYASLSRDHALLLSRTTQAEAEAAHYSALNASLASHDNAHQKILYLDRVRRERDEATTSLLAVQVALEETQKEAEAMRVKLRSFEALETPLNLRPAAKMTRVRRTETLAKTMPSKVLDASLDPPQPQHHVQQQHQVLEEPLCSTPARKLQARRTPLKVVARPLGRTMPTRRRVSGSLLPPPIVASTEAGWADELEPLTPRGAAARPRDTELTLADLTCA